MSAIVFTGGGTAGHCVPCLALINSINDSFDRICYIGSRHGIEKNIMSDVTEYYAIETVKFIRKLTLKNLLIPLKLKKAVNQAITILTAVKPNLVFSKGGYVALPVVLAANKLKIPVICHESDYTIGLSNKLTAKKCDLVLTTFEDTAKSVKNGFWTGSPIREELFFAEKRASLKRFGFDNKKPTLLIMGGSSGSKIINDTILKILDKLCKQFYVLHITGKGNKLNYSNSSYYQIEYLYDMSSAFAVADLAVSRAGSNSASELIALKIPTLFIPLSKKVSRGDQILNANFYFSKGLCHILYEEELNEESLISSIENLYKNANVILKNISSQPNVIGNKQISEIIKSYVN